MYEMMIKYKQPHVRNGTPFWTRPVVDETGELFLRQHEAADAHKIAHSQVSESVRNNLEVSGHKFRYATIAEVQARLGDKVTQVSAKTPGKKPQKKKYKKAQKQGKTIHVKGALETLDTKVLFEGHVFTGGPAVLILPGSSFRMERQTVEDFPKELRDACRWT